MYDNCLYHGLDSAEKERVLQFTSDYFKERFMVSRNLAKYILHYLPGTGEKEKVVLSRGKKEILVHGKKDLFVSLSYSGSCIALSIGKRKIGSDIEMLSAGGVRKVLSSPLFSAIRCRDKNEEPVRSLHLWTLVEAYAKFKDKNPFPLLIGTTFFPDAGFMSYCIDRKAILSIANDPGNPDNAVFWIDPATFAKDIRPAHPGGDLNVRS
jgi:4'-phosphopantetheinyl transferase